MSRMPEVGEIIDDAFRVEAELDSGNFGSVYKVHDLAGDRKLALKVLRPGPHDEKELRRRFEREARLIYSLSHKHVVGVYYYGETNSGLPYMAMEYLKGTDLRTLLKQHGPLKPKLIRRIALETLSALNKAHELGIIHRDLKPANIFLVKDGGKGHVKVLDFGFAKALAEGASDELTNAGTLVGTPAYMAPELVHKKNVGPAADLYAMGLIIAEMITGQKIVQIESVYDTIMFQASYKPLEMPPEVVASDFHKVIKRSVAKSLEARYTSARQMGGDLGGLPVVQPQETFQNNIVVPNRKLSLELEDHEVTVPRSMGLPSDDELDRVLGEETSATLNQSNNTSRSESRSQNRHPKKIRNETVEVSTPFSDEPEIRHTQNGVTEVILGAVLGIVVLGIMVFLFLQFA